MAWTEEAGYRICRQDGSYACGMACVAMIVRDFDGTELGESFFSVESSRVGARSYQSKFSERVGVVPVMASASAGGSTSVDATKELGTGMDNLGHILTNYLIENNVAHFPDLPAKFRSLGTDRWVIAHVTWSGGANHFVVVKRTGDSLVIRDPAYGVSGQTIKTAYTPNNSRAAGATATFSGWLVVPTGARLKAQRIKVM
jgi:hypothetical protein